MNTDEIRRALRILPQFDDVYSIDTLPPRPHGLLICNLDPAHCPGTHWVAIYVDGNYGEYFDSIGRAPPDSIRKYLDRWCGSANNWIFNDRQVQSVNSRLCGHYCIYYCTLRSNAISLREIVTSLSKDTAFNDVLVHAFVCKRLNNISIKD